MSPSSVKVCDLSVIGYPLMASDMRAPSSGKKSEISHGVEKCGVSDQACHGKCQSCGTDVKPFCAGVDGVSSLTGGHTDVKASKENCGACSLNNDRADSLEEEVKGSTARIGHVESADPDGCVDVKKESFMAVDDLPQEFEGEQAGATLEDLFFFNGEEEDDSDWEPASRLVENRWFCFNCTMPIVDEITHCMNCHELKGSVVDGYDVFKKQIAQTALLSADTEFLPVSTAIGFDERMLLHSEQLEVKPNPHPERPDRLRAIAASLAAAGIFPSKCALVPPREITKEELLMVHSPDHIESVEQTKNMLYSYFTSDTYANGHSACAAKLAAGLCADLASLMVSGRVRNGFALVRPPGHHAGVKQAMGFCLHNNAAVAALAAKRAGAKKVLIVDWDVHHGNGTQEIFEGDKTVLYISLHRHEDGNFYPGTGAAHEVGVLDGQGFSVNIPWSRGGVGDNDYIFAFQTVVLPIAAEFAADITIISAGFDAARGDPLGGCDVTPAGYSWMTSLLADCSNGRLLVILEGGYNLRSISSSATEVVKVLLGDGPNRASFVGSPSREALKTVSQVLKIQQQFWPVLGPTYASLQAQQGSVSSSHSGILHPHRPVVAPPSTPHQWVGLPSLDKRCWI
ncbi:histone deacetylase 15 isoform X4 [Miscanthus floridulus]|uniref:histone deacetylase 15 isoform X4 n=1 Tax=Miscanthus floridulus TaxID=154761 RepID=UPI00345828E2